MSIAYHIVTKSKVVLLGVNASQGCWPHSMIQASHDMCISTLTFSSYGTLLSCPFTNGNDIDSSRDLRR